MSIYTCRSRADHNTSLSLCTLSLLSTDQGYDKDEIEQRIEMQKQQAAHGGGGGGMWGGGGGRAGGGGHRHY
jgi:hypothetical protein